MRRVVPILIPLLLLISVITIPALARSSETDAAITAAYGTPIIDGEMDSVWLSSEVQEVLKVDKGVIPSDTATTGTIRVMWDEDYLYFFITVDKHGVPISAGGGSENTDDCADVCFTMDGNFDGENNVTGGDEYAGVFRTLLDGSFGGFGDFQAEHLDTFKGVMKKTSDSTYNSEYAISWADISPAPGYIMSMDIQINDATDGVRTGLVNWAYAPCFGWRDSKYHGMVTLLAPADDSSADETPITDDAGDGETDASSPSTGDFMILSTSAVTAACVAVVSALRRKKK